MSADGSGRRSYYVVGGALIALLALTVAATFVDMGPLNTPVSIFIAVVKALLVLLFFMHVKRGTRLTWVFAGVGFYWLAILIVLLMGDVLTRDWTAFFPLP